MQNILGFFEIYAVQGSRIGVAAFVLWLIFGAVYIKKKHIKHVTAVVLAKSIVMGFLAMYLYIMIGITLLSRSGEYDNRMNLVLFSTFSNLFYDRMCVYENILLFVPLGVFLPILGKVFRRLSIMLPVGVICSFFIELTQFLTHLGIFELDDILTNSLGTLLGWGFFSVFYTVLKNLAISNRNV